MMSSNPLGLGTMGSFSSYEHTNGKIGVIVDFDSDVDETVGRDIAMQVAAMNPSYISSNQVSSEDLENESKLARYKSLVLSSGDVEEDSYLREQLENSYAKAALGEYKVEFVDIVKNVEKIKLFFEGSEIVCSLTHKFYVNNSWKEAKDMVVGDEVSGKKLLSTQSVEDGDVVHITIEDAHTYICEGLLSHNKRYGGRRSTPTTPKPGGKPKKKKGMRARLLAARRRRALLAARRRRMRGRRRRLNERGRGVTLGGRRRTGGRSGGMLGGRRTGGRRSGAIRNRRVRNRRVARRRRRRR